MEDLGLPLWLCLVLFVRTNLATERLQYADKKSEQQWSKTSIGALHTLNHLIDVTFGLSLFDYFQCSFYIA